MRAIVLPIKGEYVKAIIEGRKKFEYRKRLCTKDIDKIYVYETAPVKKIVCSFKVEEKLGMEKKELWDATKNYSGLSREKFDAYFAKQQNGYAYAIGNVEVFDSPMDLKDLGVEHVPQGFVYIN